MRAELADTRGIVGSSRAPEWWRRSRHARPVADEAIVGAIREAITGRLLVARGERGRAIAHVAWAAGYWAERDTRGWPRVAVRYVATGIGCSEPAAREALREFARLALCVRTPTGHLTMLPEAIAACHDVATWAIDVGIMARPAVHRDREEGPSIRIDLSLLAGRQRGKVRCPCGCHARGDRDPSLLVNLATGIGTCMVSGTGFRIGLDGTATRLGISTDRREGSETLPNGTRGGTAAPSDARSRARTTPTSTRIPPRIPPGMPTGFDPGGKHVSGRLRARHVGGTLGRPALVVTDLARSSPSAREIGAVLASADRAGGGPRSRARAELAAERSAIRSWAGLDGAPQVECPDRFWSIERMFPSEFERRANRRTGREFDVPVAWTSLGSDLVLLDLDDLDEAGTDVDVDAVRRIRRAVSAPRFRDLVDGVATIVATSGVGLQVAVRLSAWRGSEQLARFYASDAAREILRDLAAAVLRAVRRGGKVDESAWATGRWARRPGWRARDGVAVRATLWFSAA